MKLFLIFSMIGIFLLGAEGAGTPVSSSAGVTGSRLLILCYHDVPKEVKLDKYGVDQETFVQHIEYLKTHGYVFVSVDEVIQAKNGRMTLPEKAVLLTFDDACASFYTFVYPLLKLYEIPCVLGVVTSWIDHPPADAASALMNWQQVQEVGEGGLVEVASHSHDLHHSVVYNPYENTSWAAVSRIYDPKTGTYETAEAFSNRIKSDMAQSRKLIAGKTGRDPRIFVWPYGQYNVFTTAAASEQGMPLTLELDDVVADIALDKPLSRILIVNNPSIQDFIRQLKKDFQDPVKQRIVHADLDLIFDVDPVQAGRNLDVFIERLAAMKVSTVYLQAFCDQAGTGNIASVYFPNRVLPMKADFFNRVANQLAIRGIEVYAWMPMLSWVLPDSQETEALRVRAWDKKGIHVSGSWYQRMSPFSEEAFAKIKMLYEDLAANARIEGFVFLDDGYLNDYEDFSPAAMKEYQKIAGSDVAYGDLAPEKQQEWTEYKTEALDRLAGELAAAVRTYRPHAKSVRTLYASAVTTPESEEWLAQNYAKSLELYDYVAVMAYPMTEEVARPAAWLKTLVIKARQHPQGLAKTVFKLQAYDWGRKRWIKSEILHRWMRILVAEGARHIGYYPDDCLTDEPRASVVRLMMSTEDFPFKRRYRETGKDLYQ